MISGQIFRVTLSDFSLCDFVFFQLPFVNEGTESSVNKTLAKHGVSIFGSLFYFSKKSRRVFRNAQLEIIMIRLAVGVKYIYAEDNRFSHMLNSSCDRIVTFQLLEGRIPPGGFSYQCGNIFPEGWYCNGWSKNFTDLMTNKPWFKSETGAFTLTTVGFSETVAKQGFSANPNSDEFILFRGTGVNELGTDSRSSSHGKSIKKSMVVRLSQAGATTQPPEELSYLLPDFNSEML